MRDADFESFIASERDTPHGGKIKFGVGALRFADGHDEPAIAVQIVSPDAPAPDHIVAQFALRMESFAVLLEGMMDVFQDAARLTSPPTKGTPHDPE